MHAYQGVIDFWFDESVKPNWFSKDPNFDAEITTKFLPLYQQAVQGDCDSWSKAATSSLALILVLDQLPRNLFRGQAAMYATDQRARELTLLALEQQFDQLLAHEQRQFLYMPLMHSEDLDDQILSVQLFNQWISGTHTWAIRHKDIVEQFGRFPHRNDILGRASTEEELEFLKNPQAHF